MLLKSINRRVSLLAVLGLLPVVTFAAVETKEQSEVEKEGVQLVGQLEDVARDVSYNTDRLNSFTNYPQISTWTHYHHLAEIKSLVNDGLRPALKRLTEIQPQLPAWQQDSIDKLINSAEALAADTNSAIFAMREAGAVPPVLNAEYKELISRMHEHSKALVQTSDAAGNYATAHREALEAGLEVPRH